MSQVEYMTRTGAEVIAYVADIEAERLAEQSRAEAAAADLRQAHDATARAAAVAGTERQARVEAIQARQEAEQRATAADAATDVERSRSRDAERRVQLATQEAQRQARLVVQARALAPRSEPLPCDACPYFQLCKRFLQSSAAPRGLGGFYNLIHEKRMCYCNDCHARRGDRDTYARGRPGRTYAIPRGWVRIPLTDNSAKAENLGAFSSECPGCFFFFPFLSFYGDRQMQFTFFAVFAVCCDRLTVIPHVHKRNQLNDPQSPQPAKLMLASKCSQAGTVHSTARRRTAWLTS